MSGAGFGAPFVVRARLVGAAGARVRVDVGGAHSVRAFDHGADDGHAAAVRAMFPGACVVRSSTDGGRIAGELVRLYVVAYPVDVDAATLEAAAVEL